MEWVVSESWEKFKEFSSSKADLVSGWSESSYFHNKEMEGDTIQLYSDAKKMLSLRTRWVYFRRWLNSRTKALSSPATKIYTNNRSMSRVCLYVQMQMLRCTNAVCSYLCIKRVADFMLERLCFCMGLRIMYSLGDDMHSNGWKAKVINDETLRCGVAPSGLW